MAVFLFFDEAGNLDFSPSGTKFYVFGALTTREPSLLFRPLSDLRYRLIAEGTDIERFHASEDRQQVRDLVFDILGDVGGFEFDSVIVRKDKVGEAFKDDLSFYPHFANFLLQGVFARYSDPDEQIVIITDRLPVNELVSPCPWWNLRKAGFPYRPKNLPHAACDSELQERPGRGGHVVMDSGEDDPA